MLWLEIQKKNYIILKHKKIKFLFFHNNFYLFIIFFILIFILFLLLFLFIYFIFIYFIFILFLLLFLFIFIYFYLFFLFIYFFFLFLFSYFLSPKKGFQGSQFISFWRYKNSKASGSSWRDGKTIDF